METVKDSFDSGTQPQIKNLLNLVGSDRTRWMLKRAVQFIVNFQNP